MTWQDEVSPTQWAEWQEIARKGSKSKKINVSLGAEGARLVITLTIFTKLFIKAWHLITLN